VARPRSLHGSEQTRAAAPSRAEVSARVETPAVESAKLEPVKPESKAEIKAEPAKTQGQSGLRRSTD
jgi:hypothetical protein